MSHGLSPSASLSHNFRSVFIFSVVSWPYKVCMLCLFLNNPDTSLLFRRIYSRNPVLFKLTIWLLFRYFLRKTHRIQRSLEHQNPLKTSEKWVILIYLQFRYTFYRSGEVPCASEDMACGYSFSKWRTTKSIWIR